MIPGLERSSNMEWRAWHRIVLALDKLGVDLNEQDDLAIAIKDWGEWRTQQHRDQDFKWHRQPDFDADEVAEAMLIRAAKGGGR